MDDLESEIARCAEQAVQIGASRGGEVLDYSEGSLELVEEILAEAAIYLAELEPGQVTRLVQDFGCYILEVGRRNHGGEYLWFEQRDQPVLVFGEPDCHVAMLAWDKVRARLSGDPADSIPFHYSGFAERARRATRGDHVLFV